MKLIEMKRVVDFLCETGHSENTVVVSLNEPSIGGSAASTVESIFSGFDWDKGKVFIRVSDQVCRKGRTLKDEKEIEIWKYSSPRAFYTCPHCGEIIKKDSKFCSSCGQKVKFNPKAEPADSYKKETAENK
jgi:hypothetical protein